MGAVDIRTLHSASHLSQSIILVHVDSCVSWCILIERDAFKGLTILSNALPIGTIKTIQVLLGVCLLLQLSMIKFRKKKGFVPIFCGIFCVYPSVSYSETPAASHYELTNFCAPDGNIGNQHMDRLIVLALSYHKATASINYERKTCTHAREVRMLEQGHSDIFWAATNKEYESTLIPIRIPIFKGLLGHRIGIISSDRQENFARITTLAQLQQVTMGQGAGWPDATILDHAGFDVTELPSIGLLYRMLLAKRFDMFPRGLMEPWEEPSVYPSSGLAVEQHMMIIYPMPAYIFITPRKPELAKIIESGLRLALEGGEFDKVLFSNSAFVDALRKANAGNRTIFS
jgi:hypothetical protein